jgi:hypothetical protein
MLAPFSGPWLVGTTKVYPGPGADIVMESIALKTPSMSSMAILRQLRRAGNLPYQKEHSDLRRHAAVPVFLLIFFAVALGQSDHDAQMPPATTHGESQGLTPEQKAKVEQLGKIQKNFGKKMNSPGVELSLREMTRSRAADRTLVRYRLHGTGLPSNITFALMQMEIDGTITQVMDGVTLDASGRAICAGREGTCQGNGPNDPIDLVVYAGKGEPKRFGLVSDDEAHVKGFVGVVPFPNVTTNKGCKLESIIGTPNGELTFVQGGGFEPNAELTIDSQSYDEKHHDTAKAEADGSYFAVILPYVSGKKSGKSVWEVKSKSCNPKLTFSWGTYHLE